jgi:hypothetical protein
MSLNNRAMWPSQTTVSCKLWIACFQKRLSVCLFQDSGERLEMILKNPIGGFQFGREKTLDYKSTVTNSLVRATFGFGKV